MLITILFIIFLCVVLWCNIYLKEYIEVTKVFKVLRKLLESRDLLLLKILPDVGKRKIAEKVLNLINDRRVKAKLSFDDAIKADVVLNSELKNLYDEIDKMKKDEMQQEIFKHLIVLEKQLKITRKKYSEAVTKYNNSLTVHTNVLVKFLRLRPFDLYK